MFDWLFPQGAAPQAPAVTPAAVPEASYGSFVNPPPAQTEPGVEQLYSPTTDVREIEARKSGWLEVLQRAASDPNIMRAVGHFGASMSQPMPQGQTLAGHFGNAMTVGRSAYDFGKENEFQRGILARREGRAEESHRATIETHQAALPGVKAQSEVTVGTAQSKIEQAKQEVERTKQLLANATTEGALKKIELEATQRRAALIKTLPEGTERNAIIAEYQKAQVEIDRARAAIKASNAAAGASSAAAASSRAKTEEQVLENKDLAAMTPEERRAFRSRKGNSSAQVQMLDAYKANWKVANPGKSEQEAATAANKFLTQAKDKGDDADFFTWAGLYGTGNYDKDIKAYRAAKGVVEPATSSGLGPAAAAVPKAKGPPPTQAELEFTAKKHGITVEEVKRRLGLK